MTQRKGVPMMPCENLVAPFPLFAVALAVKWTLDLPPASRMAVPNFMNKSLYKVA
jgi:hypothetical protein